MSERFHFRATRRAAISVLALVLVVFSFSSAAVAQLPAARLNAIFPPGGKVGTAVQVSIIGADLDGASEIRFTHPGVTAKATDKSDDAANRKFLVTISPDVPPGSYEARVIGRYGITNPRIFSVGDLAEILPSGKDPSAPLKLSVGSVASGVCTPNAVNSYAIDFKQGQRVIIECSAREIDSKMTPVLLLDSADGRELARSRHGTVMDFTAPADGAYTLQVHDLLYRGGVEYFYRVSVSEGPYVDAIFPPAGLPGSKGNYTLYGRNLPGGRPCDFHGADGKALEQLQVEIELPTDPAAAPSADAASLLGTVGAGVDAVSYRLRSDKGSSNPVLIGFSRAPLVLENEPNIEPGKAPAPGLSKAQKVVPPCEVVGRFYPHGDQGVYSFEAVQGDVFWIEVFSERLGLPTSPELLVQKVGKSNKGADQLSDVQDVGGPDMQPMGKRGAGASAAFSGSSRDVEYRFEAAKEPGLYRVTIRDLFNESTDNPALIYRMSIHKESPDFRLLATTAPVPDPKAKNNGPATELNLAPPFLRKGGVSPIRVNLFRKDGFDGEVRIEAEGLPAGVRCVPAVIAADENAATLLLVADDDAANWAGSVHIVGKATIDGEEKTHEARIGAIIWPTMIISNNNTEKSIARLTCEMPLAVSSDEVEPLSIGVGEGKFEVKANGKLHIPVTITRRIELKQPLKIQAAGLPGKMTAKIEVTIAADANSGAFDLDLAQVKLPPGTYSFYLQTEVQVKYQRKGGDKPARDDAAKGKSKGTDLQAIFYSAPISLKVLAK